MRRVHSSASPTRTTRNSNEAGGRTMDKLSLQNPVFATYVIAATLMILKAVSMSWLTVVRMMQVKGGFRSPEDIKKTPRNPSPIRSSSSPTSASSASGESS